MKENSIIPTGIKAERADYRFAGNLEMKVFALKDCAKTVVYQDHEEILRLEIIRDGAQIRGKAEGNTGCTVRFVNCALTEIQGTQGYTEGNDTVITVDENGTFTCKMQ